MSMLLAKGDDLAAWRGVEEFTAAYRDSAIRLATAMHPEGISQMLKLVEDLIGGEVVRNRNLASEMASALTAVSGASAGEPLAGLLDRYYQAANEHFSAFGSVPVYFSAGNDMLRAIAAMSASGLALRQPSSLPPYALFAMGPSGRFECTRCCLIQIAMVWDGESAQDETLIAAFAEDVVASLRMSGLVVDELHSPVHGQWRGSLEQWEEWFSSAVTSGDEQSMARLTRLVDRSVLVDSGGVWQRFSSMCGNYLQSPAAVANMVERSQSLSNGLGMMGGLRLEKEPPHKGKFALLDYALLPLAANVAAISMHNEIQEETTPGRLRELVRNGMLDVDLAERAMRAWYLFNEHRIGLEIEAVGESGCKNALYLSPEKLGDEGIEKLRTALETIGNLKRHLQVSFGRHS